MRLSKNQKAVLIVIAKGYTFHVLDAQEMRATAGCVNDEHVDGRTVRSLCRAGLIETKTVTSPWTWIAKLSPAGKVLYTDCLR